MHIDSLLILLLWNFSTNKKSVQSIPLLDAYVDGKSTHALQNWAAWTHPGKLVEIITDGQPPSLTSNFQDSEAKQIQNKDRKIKNWWTGKLRVLRQQEAPRLTSNKWSLFFLTLSLQYSLNGPCLCEALKIKCWQLWQCIIFCRVRWHRWHYVYIITFFNSKDFRINCQLYWHCMIFSRSRLRRWHRFITFFTFMRLLEEMFDQWLLSFVYFSTMHVTDEAVDFADCTYNLLHLLLANLVYYDRTSFEFPAVSKIRLIFHSLHYVPPTMQRWNNFHIHALD